MISMCPVLGFSYARFVINTDSYRSYSWTTYKNELMNMPSPDGGIYSSGVGHSGNGYARITYIGNSI